MFNLNVKFNAAPPGASNFANLRVTLTDAGNTNRVVNKSAGQIAAEATLQPDGSYVLPVSFTTVAVGPYTVVAQSYDAANLSMGSPASGSGVVSLVDGVWYPQPFAFA